MHSMDLLSPPRQVYNKDGKSLHYCGQKVLSDDVADETFHENETYHNKPQQSNGSIKNTWKLKGKMAKNEYPDRIINERRGMLRNESSSLLFENKDLQLDLLEGSLLNEVGVESIIDIQCPSTHFSITASSTIPKIPSHSKFLHLESNMLSPIQCNKILLPFPTDTSRKHISSNTNVKLPLPTEQENKDVKTLKPVDETSSVSLTYKDHDYCLNKFECSKNQHENEAACNMLPLQSCSHLTKRFSKAFLKTVGLTNINLETLADTHSISLSLYDVKKVAGTTSRHEERVKLRRKDFLKVMRRDKITNKSLNKAYLQVTEMRCQLLDGNTTMRQIEFITDLLYCAHELSDGVRHLLTCDPRYSIKNQDGEVTGFDEIQGVDELKQNCKDRKLLLTKRMASLSPSLKQEATKTYLCDNPPVVEASRSVSFTNKKAAEDISKGCVTNNVTDEKSNLESENVEDKNKSCDNHKNDIPTRQLRSHKIKLTVHTPQKKSVDSIHQAEPIKDIEVESSEHSREYDEEFIVYKPTEMLQEWISVSDGWLREFLDVESMLQLI